MWNQLQSLLTNEKANEVWEIRTVAHYSATERIKFHYLQLEDIIFSEIKFGKGRHIPHDLLHVWNLKVQLMN